MLYQVVYDYLTQSVESELIRRGYRPGRGQTLVDLHLDERFYVMPIQVDVAAQQVVLSETDPQGELVERLAHAVEFEDLTHFGGVLRVFARTLLNRAGVGDVLRGHAADDANLRRHTVPRVSRVLDAIAAAPDYLALTDYDTLLGVIETAAIAYIDQDGPQGLLAEDVSTIRSLRAAGVGATRQEVRVVAQRSGLQGWVKWTRGLYSGIRCLSAVSGLDPQRFQATVEASIAAPGGPLNLGLRLEGSVQEMGLALAMSFFGDLGYPEFAKPDRHVVNALRAYEGSRLSARQAFEQLELHSRQAGINPRRLDKVLYLAGSGNFYLTGFNFGPKFKAGLLERLLQAGGQRALVQPLPVQPLPAAAYPGNPLPNAPYEEPAEAVEAGDELAAEVRFYIRMNGSVAAQALVDRVDELCEDLQAEVHFTHTAGGDLRVRADRPNPHPRVQNVVTMVWANRKNYFSCQALLPADECIGQGMPPEGVRQNTGSLSTWLNVRPGVDDEAFMSIVGLSVQRFRGQ